MANLRDNVVCSAPFFIVGPPRSGTTLLRECLNRHSRLQTVFETGFFIKLDGNRRLLPARQIAAHRELLLDRLYQTTDPSVAQYEKCRSAISNRLSLGVKSYREVAEIIFREFAKEDNKMRWGEKTPFHAMYIGRIFRLFPEAKVIHISREPKNTIASYLGSRFLPDYFLGACASYLICRRVKSCYFDRVLMVSYEKLTSDPEKVLRAVCDYLGERFEPQMLIPCMSNSSYDEVMFKQGSDIGINLGNKDKWESILTPEQAAFVDYVTGVKMKFRFRYIPWLCLLSVRLLRAYLRVVRVRMGYSYIVIDIRSKLFGRIG